MNDDAVQPRDWEELKDLVAEALDRPVSERARFIESACESPSMRTELAALVEAAAPDEHAFLLDPRADAFAGVRGADPAAFAGATFGRFTLIRVIGEGGMGVVYLARQQGVERDVAIKVFAPQSIGLDARLRFEREVRALGRIAHPGVARIYDAGLHADPARPGGMPVPFIAMELVQGLPLTRHAESLRLPLRARIALLADAADAVHAAHQRAVIHRDLKPANILVASPDDAHPFGSVKVLDFGIARVLHEGPADAPDDGRTTAGMLLGSLAYMAPEQARGESHAIDVRTDIYALGVILHELVTGHTPVPVDDLPLTESLRLLADPDLRTPRVPDDFTSGDLGTVLATALAPEPERRYASAEAFADDLRRLLRSDPVAARPATRSYRARKFVRRHRAGVAAATAVALSLVGGLALAGVGFVRERAARERTAAALLEADRQRENAETERRRAEASRDFLAQIVASADPEYFGRDATVIEAVRAALPMLDTFQGSDPGANSSLRLTVAQTFRNLGVLDDADEAFRDARRLAEAAYGKGSPQSLFIAFEHADMLGVRGQLDEAASMLEDAASAVKRAPEGRTKQQLALTLRISRANLASERGEYATSVALYDEAFEELEKDPTLLSEYDRDTVRAHYGLALSYAGELQDAEAVQRAVAADRARRMGETHPRSLIVLQHLAGTLTDLGQLDEAESLLHRVLEHGAPLWGETHHFTLGVRHTLAALALTRGDFESAAEMARGVLETGADQTDTDAGGVLFLAANTHAVALASLERWDEAIPAMRSVVEIAAATFGPEHHYTLITRSSLANALGKTGDPEAALAELEDLLRMHVRARGPDDENALITRNNIGMLELDLGRADRAVERIGESLARAEATGRLPMVALFRRNYGRALTASGRYQEAETQLLLALEEAKTHLDEAQQQRTAEALDALYEAWGN